MTARRGIDWDAVVWDLIERTAGAAVRGLQRGWNTSTFVVRTSTAVPSTFRQLDEAVPSFAGVWDRAPFIGKVGDLPGAPEQAGIRRRRKGDLSPGDRDS
jgi:hypothetical protein